MFRRNRTGDIEPGGNREPTLRGIETFRGSAPVVGPSHGGNREPTLRGIETLEQCPAGKSHYCVVEIGSRPFGGIET